MENSVIGNTNTLFPYNDMIEQQFKLLDTLEETIPRFTPHLWNREPEELNTFLAQEQEERKKRGTFLDRWYKDIEKSVEESFPRNNINFWEASFRTMSLEYRRAEDERALRVLRRQNLPLMNKDSELERYFHNASPIPRILPEEENILLRDDYVRGIPFIHSPGDVLEEDILCKEKTPDCKSNTPIKSMKRNYRMALATGTPVEEEIKRQEESHRKKESLKHKRKMKKFNEVEELLIHIVESMITMYVVFVPDNAEPVGILPTANRARCGRKGFDSGNSGGADMAEWPWHAAILEKPQDLYVCGSTLLDESWVLTAAHCVDDYLPFVPTIQDILKVRLGEYDVSTTAEPLRHEEFNVTDIVMHPGFNNSTLVHDIALLKLERPAKRKQNIDVVCMPKSRDFNPSQFARCYVTGWGRRTETSEHSLVLKEIEVPLWSYTNCNGALKAQFGPAYSLPTTAICAGAEGRDACDGDGGGPLVCEKEGKWYQIGIVSFGIGCGRKNIPGVYTKVSEYDSWIENVILGTPDISKKKKGFNSKAHHN
nr:uncharacterized protein LOC121118475 [Lepeophtheirus salmonis]